MANELSNVPVNDGAILLTGATGLLGGEVLARLLARTDREVVALVRRPLGFEHPRLTLLMADLTDDAPLPAPDVEITQVIHCAASVSFTLPIEEQREINVDGTRRLLELAATFPNLERFMHVSTAYVAGTFEGEFGPDDLQRGQGFRNTYEQSKHEAEVLVSEFGLPFQVIRPSIVVGDQTNGRTNAFNVLYPPMKAYALGKMHVAPGRKEAPVDVVPIDHVADAMMALLEVEPGRTHLVVAGEQATTVGELVQLGADYFERPVGQVLTAQELDDLIAQLPEEQREKAQLALERSAHVLPYFDVRAEYRDPFTANFLAERGLALRPLREYFSTLMDYATEANWGKEPVRAAA
ncbi:MAG: SDR family oxidoreductase [Patulibacter minatonensis]